MRARRASPTSCWLGALRPWQPWPGALPRAPRCACLCAQPAPACVARVLLASDAQAIAAMALGTRSCPKAHSWSLCSANACLCGAVQCGHDVWCLRLAMLRVLVLALPCHAGCTSWQGSTRTSMQGIASCRRHTAPPRTDRCLLSQAPLTARFLALLAALQSNACRAAHRCQHVRTPAESACVGCRWTRSWARATSTSQPPRCCCRIARP